MTSFQLDHLNVNCKIKSEKNNIEDLKSLIYTKEANKVVSFRQIIR